jgi:hypothetical protein
MPTVLPTVVPSTRPTKFPTQAPTRRACSASGYPTPYSIGNDGSLLNTVLNAWGTTGCDGTLRFTTGGAVMQLTQQYVISNRKLILDASGLRPNVVLLPARQAIHFTVQSSGNVTAKGITFTGSRVNITSNFQQLGGAFFLQFSGSLYLESCIIQNNTIVGEMFASGGGICSQGGGELRLRNTVIRDNKAIAKTAAEGGGIYVYNTKRVIIEWSNITGNTCEVGVHPVSCPARILNEINECWCVYRGVLKPEKTTCVSQLRLRFYLYTTVTVAGARRSHYQGRGPYALRCVAGGSVVDHRLHHQSQRIGGAHAARQYQPRRCGYLHNGAYHAPGTV